MKKQQRLQSMRRTTPHQVIQKNGWQLYSPYFLQIDMATENLEDLELLHEQDPVEEIQKHKLSRIDDDYQENIGIRIK